MITIRPVVPTEVLPEIKALMAAHWRETESSIGDGPDPQAELYKAGEDAGVVVAFGAFDGETMVGYVTVFVTSQMHYGFLCANHDTLFVHKDYRGRTGIALVRAAEKESALRGAKFIAWHAKIGSAFEQLLRRMNYPSEEIIFRKELACQ
jgi:GNAT superfamily N-acetyltransferase